MAGLEFDGTAGYDLDLPRVNADNAYVRYCVIKIPATNLGKREDIGWDAEIDLTELNHEKLIGKLESDPNLPVDFMKSTMTFSIKECSFELKYHLTTL